MSADIKKTEVEKTFQTYASEYLERGMSPLPVKPGDRGAEVRGWSRYSVTPPSKHSVDTWKENYPEYGISLVMGTALQSVPGQRFGALDIDQNRFVEDVMKLVFDDPRNANAAKVTKFGSKGLTIFIRPEGEMKSQSFNGSDGMGIEVLLGGRQCVIPPSQHHSGVRYEWRSDATLLDVDLSKLPIVDEAMVAEMKAMVVPQRGVAAARAAAPTRAAVPANDNSGQRSRTSYHGEGKFSGLDQLVAGNIHNAELWMTYEAARWDFQHCPDDPEAREVAINSVVELAFVAAEKAGEADRWDRDEEMQRVSEMYNGAVAKYSDKWATGTSADDGTFGALNNVEILDVAPEKMTRPLALIGGHGYASAWVPVQKTVKVKSDPKTGEVKALDVPVVTNGFEVVILRDDGHLFSDAGINGAYPLSELGFDATVREKPVAQSLWSGRGVKSFRSGEKTDTKLLFENIVEAFDVFIDFNKSMADQRTMCEMAACYVIATYCLDAFNVIGYLYPNGERGAGKSHFLYTVSRMAYLGQVILAGSSFATLRDLADYGACLAFDDCEEISNPKTGDPNKRDLILAGNRRGAQIALKEPDGKNGWVTRIVDAFAPRLFSAINRPDGVLGSRTITIPLVRSGDPGRSDADPMDDNSWPIDRSKLVDDLWVFGLTNLSEMQSWDSKVPALVKLHGRQLEPWRAIFAVALCLENNYGVDGLFDRLEKLAMAYQDERQELEVDDPPRLLVVALWGLLDSKDRSIIETARIVEEVETIAGELGVKDGYDSYTNAHKTGKLLSSLRFRKAPKGKSARSWDIRSVDVEAIAATHGVTLKTNAESAGSAETPVDVEAEKVDNNGTSAFSAHAALGLEVDSLADDFVDV
jgi:hypothetical protein